MKKLISIKEFSTLSGVEVPTLRYWDTIGLFRPEMRGDENGYRYYSPFQLISIKFITVLRELGVPAKKIAALRDNRNPENVTRLIEGQENILDREMRRLQECYSVIHTRLELIRLGNAVREPTIMVLERPEMSLIFGAPNEFRPGETFYGPFVRFCHSARDLRINLSYPIGGFYRNFNEFVKDADQPYRFFSVDDKGSHTLAAGRYLTGFIRGYYGDFGDLPARMAEYARAKNLRTSGPVYCIWLYDEVCVRESSDFFAHMFVQIEEEA